MSEPVVEEVKEEEQELVTTEKEQGMAIGTMYPTVALHKLMTEYRKILTSEDKKLVKAFRKRSCLYTNFTEMEDVFAVLTLFKTHLPLFANKADYEAKAKPDVNKLCETFPEKSKDIVLLYMSLMEHFMKENYALFICTAHDEKNGTRGSYELIDIRETKENARFVTISHCGHCLKGPEIAPLLLCGKCKKAAYCNAKCQAADWSQFHKLFCAQLADNTTKAADK